MRGANPAHPIRQTVNHDGAAGRDTELGRALAILLIWIGNMQRPVIVAGRIARVDDVVPLRRSAVALALLGRQAAATQRHFVGANHLSAAQQFENVVLLQNQDGVGLLRRMRLLRHQRNSRRSRIAQPDALHASIVL